MAGRFVDRVAIITGAGSGLGRATALRFAEEGARVACIDVDEARAKTTASDIAAVGGTTSAYGCDISNPESVAAAVGAVADEFGGVHVLCNVAGIGTFAHTVGFAFADWSRIIGVNLTGTFLMCQAALPHLLVTKGNIVNVASDGGAMGLPYGAAYSASKGGVVLLTKSLAREFIDRGIRINAVSPGGMATGMPGFVPPDGANMAGLARFSTDFGVADPADVANVIAFVASDEANRMTGSIVAADGGTTV